MNLTQNFIIADDDVKLLLNKLKSVVFFTLKLSRPFGECYYIKVMNCPGEKAQNEIWKFCLYFISSMKLSQQQGCSQGRVPGVPELPFLGYDYDYGYNFKRKNDWNPSFGTRWVRSLLLNIKGNNLKRHHMIPLIVTIL